MAGDLGKLKPQYRRSKLRRHLSLGGKFGNQHRGGGTIVWEGGNRGIGKVTHAWPKVETEGREETIYS